MTLFNKKKMLSLIKGTKEETPLYVFNLAHLSLITNIKKDLSQCSYKFYLYFNNGLNVCVQLYSDYDPIPLEKLRKLFINNIGFSFLSVGEDMLRGDNWNISISIIE